MIVAASLVAVGFACWWVSTLGAGGGAVLFLPIARVVIEPHDVPIVIAVASAISSVQRTWLYRRDVDVPVFLANLPGLIVGAATGAWLLRGLPPQVLSILVGGFLLVFSLSQMLGGDRVSSCPRRRSGTSPPLLWERRCSPPLSGLRDPR